MIVMGEYWNEIQIHKHGDPYPEKKKSRMGSDLKSAYKLPIRIDSPNELKI